MLLDDTAYEEVFFGVHRLIDALSPGLLHILCGTVSPSLCERLAVEHANRNIDFVAAPVVGSITDAENGLLITSAAGADQAIARAHPLLETFSRVITVVGKAPQQAFAINPEDFSSQTP